MGEHCWKYAIIIEPGLPSYPICVRLHIWSQCMIPKRYFCGAIHRGAPSSNKTNSNKIKQFKWISILSKKKVRANSHHFFSVKNNKVFTHIKFNIFPDGGVARLRLYGSIAKSNKLKNKKINLASLLDGASVIACNNEHFGKAENILAPGKAKIWVMAGKLEDEEIREMTG